MNSCDHYTWLQIVDAKESALCDTGRLSRLLPELRDAARQQPSLLFFIGRKAKEVALRALFPWNNVKKGKRDGIASLRIDTTTIESQYPIFFAESDQSTSFTPPSESRLSCHRTRSFPIQWDRFNADDLFDLVHGRLFCLFADVLCIFADDYPSFDAVVDQLQTWAILGRDSSQAPHVRPMVVIVKKGNGPSPSPTYDLLERSDVQLSLLRQDLIDFFSSVVVLHLADEQISPIARHRCLKGLLKRLMTDMRQLRQSHGCLYTALHLSHFFTAASEHTARTVNEPFDFLVSSRRANLNTTEYLVDFLNLCTLYSATREQAAAFIASTLLLDAYQPGLHEFDPSLIYESMYKPWCIQALDDSQDDGAGVEDQSQDILDRFTDLFGAMHNFDKKASELHQVNARKLIIPWALFHTSRTCLSCLRNRPEHVLTCGHTICDACILMFGTPMAHADYQYRIDPCILCDSGSLNIILQPPTAAYRVLSIDGGGIRGVIPLEFLKYLQEILGPACMVRDLFDIAFGTSSGGLIILGLFLRQWSVIQGAQNFESLTKNFFQAQERSRGGLFRCIRRIVKCWMSDAYYDATKFESTLKLVFGERTRMFDSRPTPEHTKVAVTATTISDALPYIFSNYNGSVRRQRDCGYQHLRPRERKDEPCVWEAGRATSAAPMLFRPAHIPSIGTFQDGGLKHNNPINLALWESRRIWPAIDKPDVVISLGTGTTRDSSTPTAPNFRHVIHDGFIPRLWRSFMSSLDGQSAWRDLWNRLDGRARQDFFRLNVGLSGEGPAMDDVDRMEELRESVQQQLKDDPICQQVAFALLVSTFFFELSSVPLFHGGQYYCRGTIHCRLPGKSICRTLEKVHESRLAFMTDDEILGCFQSFDDLCVECNRYSKEVEFTVRHLAEPLSIYLQSTVWGKRKISAFPQTMQWFMEQQHLEARFGRTGHIRASSCGRCCRLQTVKHHSSMPKRKMTEYSAEASHPRRKRQCSATTLEPWDGP